MRIRIDNGKYEFRKTHDLRIVILRHDAAWHLGIRAHAFGIKTEGLALFGHRIASADSMTWSSIARRRKLNLEQCQLDGHLTAKETPQRGAKNCANCRRWAVEWHRTRILRLPPTSREICESPRGIRP